MFSTRQKLFIIIGLVSGLVAAGLIFYIISSKKESTTVQTNLVNSVQNANTTTTTSTAQRPAVVPLSPLEQERLYTKQLAGIFVERFATYSNQNSNKNIDDAIALSTASMGAWLDTQRIPYSVDYKGVSTMVIASQVLSFGEGLSEVKVDTRQLVEDTVNGQVTENRSGRVQLAKVGDAWKVDGFFWEK